MDILKKTTNLWLMAALVCGLALSVASCSSDNDDKAPAAPTEEPVNSKPGDDTPDDVSIDEELSRLLSEHNGAEDSVYFFLEEAKKQGNFISGKYQTCRYTYLSTTADGPDSPCGSPDAWRGPRTARHSTYWAGATSP